jgi:hypothetical protein
MLKKGLYASFFLISLTGLGGCEQLGLDDDEEAPPPPPEVLPPELIIPEPLEPIPIPRVLFYKGTDYNDPANPIDFIYSYLIASKTVLKQSSGLSAEAQSRPIPLGNNRFSHGYIVVSENNRFYLGAADTDVLTQLSTFSETLCTPGSFRLVSDGVGYVNTYIVAQTPGVDALCGSSDDAYFRINFTASPTDGFQSASAYEFFGAPLQNSFWKLSGLFSQEDNAIAIRSTDGGLLRNFGSLGSTDFSPPLRNEGALLFAVDGALYDNTAEILVGSDPLAPLTLLDSPTLNSLQSVIDGSTVYTLDGMQLKSINRSDGSTLILSNLAGLFTPDPAVRLQISDNYLWTKSSDNRLFRIGRQSGAVEEVMNNVFESFLIANEAVYVTSKEPETDVLRAKKFPAGSNLTPLCKEESGATVDEQGCVSNSRWIIIDRYSESGTAKIPLLFSGKETQKKTKDDRGNDIIIIFPPQDGIFFNSPDLWVFNTQTGTPQINLGAAVGYVRIQEIGVVEISHGLLSLTSLTKVVENDVETEIESTPDIYYFNTNASKSFKIVANTPQVEEEMTALTTE